MAKILAAIKIGGIKNWHQKNWGEKNLAKEKWHLQHKKVI